MLDIPVWMWWLSASAFVVGLISYVWSLLPPDSEADEGES